MRYLGGCGQVQFQIYPQDISRDAARKWGHFLMKVEPVMLGDDLCLKVEMSGYHKEDGIEKNVIDTIVKLENGFPKPPPVEVLPPPPDLLCNICGHTTVHNGTCYRCLNCGNTMGGQGKKSVADEEMKAIKETLTQVLDELKKKGHSPEHAQAILMAREQENIEGLTRALDREHEFLEKLGVTRPNPVRGWVMNRRRREGWFRRLLRRIFMLFARRNWR